MAIRSPQEAGQKRSANAVGNFSFTAKIFTLLGGESPALQLPVDAVRGLGGARANIIRHRVNPSSEAVTTPYPGLSTPDAVTLEGSFLFEVKDLIALQAWKDQAEGNLAIGGSGEIAGYFRNITITPHSTDVDDDGGNISPILAGEFKLINAVPVRLSISDFDVNAPAICNWSLEVEFEDMLISPPVG